MAIRLNSISNVNFSAENRQNNSAKSNDISAISNVALQPKVNEYKGFNGFIARVANFYLNTTTVTGGIIKGIFDATIAGTAIAAFDVVKRACFAKDVKFLDALAHPTKALGKVGKIFAPIIATTILATDVIASVLHANKKTADVDHELKTGHRS